MTSSQWLDIAIVAIVFGGSIVGNRNIAFIAEVELSNTPAFLDGLIDMIEQLAITGLAAISSHLMLANADTLIILKLDSFLIESSQKTDQRALLRLHVVGFNLPNGDAGNTGLVG